METTLSPGHRPADPTAAEAAASPWTPLYRVAAVSALLMALFIPVQVAVFIASPPPATVIGWFELYQRNPLLGLLDMDLLLLVDQVLMMLVFVAIYVALRESHQALMAISLALGFIGIACYFSSGAAFEMLTLSNQYAAATTEAEKTVALAAGQVMVATWQGTAFDVGYVLEGTALLIFAVVMVRSRVFGRGTAYIALWLGVMSLIPPTAGAVGMLFALGSLVPLEIFDILVARRFLQMR